MATIGEKQPQQQPSHRPDEIMSNVDDSFTTNASIVVVTTMEHNNDKDDNNQQQQDQQQESRSQSLNNITPSFSFLDNESSLQETADFDFDFEIPLRWYKRVWTFVLCIGGIFDILAYAEPILRSYAFCRDSINDVTDDSSNSIIGNLTTAIGFNGSDMKKLERTLLDTLENDVSSHQSWGCSVWITFLNRLNDYNVVISFSFSLLWFKYSHAKAREEYYNATIKKDRIQLLSSEEEEEAIKKKKKKEKKINPRYIFYRRILLRVVLLPVGFYIILYHFMKGLISGKWLVRELLIAPVNNTVFLTIKDPNEYVIYEISKERAKMSTICAILHYLYHVYLAATIFVRAKLGEYFKNSAIPQLRRTLVTNGFRNPRKLIRQLVLLLKYIRWTKYIIPLIGKLNKLRGGVVSTIRKRRQYSIAKKQKLIYKFLWKKKSPAEKEQDAAILIQRVWRAYQNQMYHRVVAIFSTKDKRLTSAMKIQLAFRRMALKSRCQLLGKRRELHRLERERIASPKNLNEDERRRLYELQDTFMTEANKTINKRLLMRPNTKLAVRWNYLFIVCILYEFSHVALRPWLQLPKTKNKKKEDNKVKYISMREFVATSLTPTRVSETPECGYLFQKQSWIQRLFHHQYGAGYHDDPHHQHNNTIPWMCAEPIVTYRDSFRDIIVLTFSPHPISQWEQCQVRKSTLIDRLNHLFHNKNKTNKKPPPWYCSNPYVTIHNYYRSIWNFVIDETKIVISIVCFLDVFVKFFTGEIDATTGELRPRPFFRRWIIPGLLFQLLVNPAIGTFSTIFFQITDGIVVIGPVRAARWCIAVVVPIVYALRFLIIRALQEAESDKQLVQYGMMLWEYSY